MRGATCSFNACPASAAVFQLTRPMRGATSNIAGYDNTDVHFNSHAPCGAQPPRPPGWPDGQSISTHTPHAGRNASSFVIPLAFPIISTHTPHAGRNMANGGLFRSTIHFNSHAPCGAQPDNYFGDTKNPPKYFNSHAPCGAQLFFFYIISAHY